MRLRRFLSAVTPLVVALLAVVLPAAFLLWLLWQPERLEEVTVDPLPVVVPVGTSLVTEEQLVTVRLAWGEPVPLVAPAWTGTVTAVHLRAGESVDSGDRVVTIDATDRLAAATPRPFWRPLGSGDQGPGVAQLQEMLAAWGFHHGEADGLYGRGTAEAVKAWAASLGVTRPDGGFDPGWVVWMPSDPFSVQEVDLGVSGPAPAPGSPIAFGPTPLAEARVESLSGEPLELEPSLGYVLEVRGQEFGAEAAEGVVAGAGLSTLATLVDEKAEAVEGRLRRVAPIEVLEVPATAVMANRSGQLCVWVPEADGYVPRKVEVADATVGVAQLAPDLQATEVLANPAEILPDPTCP